MAGPSRALLCVAATPAGWPRIGTGRPATLSAWLSASGLRLPLPLPPSSPWFPGRARQRREAREKCGRHRVVPRLPHGLLTLSTRARGVVLTVVAWRCDGSCIMLGQARTVCLAWHTDSMRMRRLPTARSRVPACTPSPHFPALTMRSMCEHARTLLCIIRVLLCIIRVIANHSMSVRERKTARKRTRRRSRKR